MPTYVAPLMPKTAGGLWITAGHGDRYIGSLFRVDEPVPDDSCQVENVLWDTGATNTLISQEIVDALGLQPKNKALISSAGGDVESWTYLVHVILPTETAELNVQALLNDNSDYDVVIGMDIINSCDFCYTNKDGKSTFSLCHPAKEKIILK